MPMRVNPMTFTLIRACNSTILCNTSYEYEQPQYSSKRTGESTERLPQYDATITVWYRRARLPAAPTLQPATCCRTGSGATVADAPVTPRHRAFLHSGLKHSCSSFWLLAVSLSQSLYLWLAVKRAPKRKCEKVPR